MRESGKVALTAVMSALAIALSLLRVELPYPVLPYLKFDSAEIPVTLTAFLCGFKYAAAAELMHFLGLVVRGSPPVDASMKLFAVLSMLAGLAMPLRSLPARFATAAATRVAVMTAANYAYLHLLFPRFLEYALKLAGGVELLYLYTAVFNVVHTAASVGLSWVAAEEVRKRITLP